MRESMHLELINMQRRCAWACVLVEQRQTTLTYLGGQKTELSDEGGSGFHQVGALSEEEKTVVLEQSKDSSN